MRPELRHFKFHLIPSGISCNFLILLFVSTAIITGFNGCKENVNEPQNVNPLEGTWVENYSYNTPLQDRVYPCTGDEAEEDEGYPASSEITFSGDQVRIKILPLQRTFGQDSLGNPVTMNKMDSLYSGSYTIKKDTLIITIAGVSRQDNFKIRHEIPETRKYILHLKGDTLDISFYPKSSGRYYAVPVAEWLWGGSWMKLSGKFVKQR